MLISKRSDWGFINHGQIKIIEIKKELDAYLLEWLEDESRQKVLETHQHTFMWPIRQLDYLHTIGENNVCKKVKSLKNKQAREELEEIFKKLEQITDGKVIRAEFINMKPNSRIRTHKDRSDTLYLARRYHIPIKTNELVFFTSGKYTENLKEGIIYDMNNINYHSVRNKSSYNRIHLIIDVLPNEYTDGIEFE